MRKQAFMLCLFILACIPAFTQRQVSQEKMTEIYEQVRTPHKYGMVIAPQTNEYKIDCPTVFRHEGRWYMTYLVYNGRSGNDGRGYETWLAESDNLLEWTTKGRILPFRDGTWDCNQRGGFPALPDMEWGGSYSLQPFRGNYWMTYIGGASSGYEAAPLKVGVAFTPENRLTEAHEWQALSAPVLAPEDKDAQWFENITQYKSTVYWDKAKTLGAPFVMFYNAGGRNPESQVKAERIGIALSKDMKKWKRYSGNPVFTHEEGITGDAHIQKMGDVYVMFYFSAFRADRPYKAFNTFACSYDLIHWSDWKGEDLVIPSKDYDNLFAHKSNVINHKGVVYHFYCATNKFDQRGIALAVSKPLGHSVVRFPKAEIKNRRSVTELSDNWQTALEIQGKAPLYKNVSIPHNWDDYFGYRQLTHGNLHGTALYETLFQAPEPGEGKRFFLRFEGVGTYATVTVNGKGYGRHLSGRTTFTLDVTDALKPGVENRLSVRAEHPELISDMPWVCGGCSSEWGFSEGSQPLGIFRPVVLEVTDEIRIEPFGVHIWNNDRADSIYIDTEVKNYSSKEETVEVVNKLNNEDGIAQFRLAQQVRLAPGEIRVIRQSSPLEKAIYWSTERPYLYKLASMIKRGTRTTDEITTPFGVRTISWPVKRADNDGRFYLNGKPVFINGVCEYEHQFGNSHAFSHEQIKSRVKQIKSAGFNAFRDAHQPHHLDYQQHWDENGILFWTQFSAHVWYDTPEFRANFKQLLRQWVKERRNSPSVVMWGLQNESTLPRSFTEECCEMIREMDPTARTMRVITTCNGGEGSDWNVVQNWSGTYGGDLSRYASELSEPVQLLNGEYGAWRSLGLHAETTTFEPDGLWSEERMCLLMETKIRLAEQAKESVCGQFQWIYSSHDNPGRRQADEAFRLIDKVGPFNYKGLVAPWEEPLDVYYMYRANYVPASKDPMVYISSHTWPDRFLKRTRSTVEVYSNCDSVKLYNDASDACYLGKKMNRGKGTHFIWENRDIRYNVLKAVGYYKGKAVAEDRIVLNNLEEAPNFSLLHTEDTPLLKGDAAYTYLYRINCGGDAYTDQYNQHWATDDTTFSRSWAEKFEGLNPYLASQRVTYDPIKGVRDWSLFQHFRYGRCQLSYRFPVPDGDYRIELFFTEPWHGTGGGEATDCEGLRLFDVAVNDSTVIDDLDIWAEVGHDVAYKRVVYTTVKGGELCLSFPEIKAGQAVMSAIAIATTDTDAVARFSMPVQDKSLWNWAKADTMGLAKTPKELLPEDKNSRPSLLYQAEDATVKGSFTRITHRRQDGICFRQGKGNQLTWNISTGLAQVYALRFKYMNTSGKPIPVMLQLIGANGIVLKSDQLTFPETPDKWRMMSTTTGSFINAGHYQIVISAEEMNGLQLDALEVQ